MTFKRRALRALTRAELLDIGRGLELEVSTGMRLDELVDAVAGSKRATLERILPSLTRDTLKSICFAVGEPAEGREKQVIIDRILAASGADERPVPKGKKGTQAGAEAPFALTPPAPPAQPSLPWVAPVARVAVDPVPPASPSRPPVDAADHTADHQPAPAVTPLPFTAPTARAPSSREITLEVTARKPRLAWQGMWRKEAALSVPSQVVEIVRPGRAVDRGAVLSGIDTRTVEARDVAGLPANRLIWTNDNLVALQTLLDEKDPVTRDWRYRGKVDLVYIDPPFMVNNDFRADNTVDIDLDDEAHVQVKKEPSLVEILAYKDTWRQGLDSFLTMLRRRLELLKELMAPSGSIYVHLDWHAVHYVKVLMDEIFGYETFQNEIVWKRSSAHSDSGQGSRHFGRVSDTVLFYTASERNYWQHQFTPYDADYVASDYRRLDPDGRRYRIGDLSGPGGEAKGNPFYEFLGVSRYWRFSKERMQELYEKGRIIQTKPGAVPQYKRYLDEMPGIAVQNIWSDSPGINNRSIEVLGYPTQKPVALLERIISASCPPGGLVLDCFLGSGTTADAAERLGRRWIGIDNGKYAVHLARKRLIQLHGQPRPPEKPQADFVECDKCKNVERKEKAQRSPGTFSVRPFTVENMGVYQRAEAWQDFQTRRSVYRDEMIRVFGGEPVAHSPLLHGRKGGSWIHVGPLDGPISSGQVWNIAREAQHTNAKAVTILSADFDTLSGSEKEDVQAKTGVTVTIRVIPAQAIDEVRRRMQLLNRPPDAPIESMAIPAFYAPLSIVLSPQLSGRIVKLHLERCEVDIESFLASQRPVLKPVTDATTPAARRKAEAEAEKWSVREAELQKWLQKADSWQKFVDFWAVDWNYGTRVGQDDKPIFETDWQSFRLRKSKGETEPLVFVAEFKYTDPGQYRIAARVTDVFGNDGIATVNVEVK
jgi:adenine-specific DNA-methyltransferase